MCLRFLVRYQTWPQCSGIVNWLAATGAPLPLGLAALQRTREGDACDGCDLGLEMG